MRDIHRSVLRITGQVVAGVAVGAVVGFALLSLRFVAANQYPTPDVAMIVVLVSAVAGGAVAGIRLWRQRPVRDEAVAPMLVRARESVRTRRAAVALWRAARGAEVRDEEQLAVGSGEPTGVSRAAGAAVAPVPDAA